VRGTLIICPDLESLNQEAARRLVSALAQAEKEGQMVFRLALAGGSTPRCLYQLLASQEFRTQIPWERLHFFWGDERVVPHDHPQSNYRMAREALLKHVPVPRENIHPVSTQASLEDTAQTYERELREHFGRGVPAFDLVLLGMGPDGHTASLFPASAALKERERLVVAHRVEGKGLDRITLTLPVLNQARRIFFLVTGKSKATTLRAAIAGGGPLPVQQIAPRKGELVWLVDTAAAGRLERLRVEAAVGSAADL
jgi:6-phosphogluconolactonase